MRTEDVGTLLRRAAARPNETVDVGAVLRRGRVLRRRRALSAGTGAAAVLTVALVAPSLGILDRAGEPKPGPAPVGRISVGWTEFPLPDEVRAGAALVWTGSELLAWGGCDPDVEDECEPTADGYSFDPVVQAWRGIDAAPSGGAHANAAWTGTEAIFLGEGAAGSLAGQAYSPATGAWRTIAPAPIEARSEPVTVWTGSEVIVWGGGSPGDPSVVSGAAYDPAEDAWRLIPDAPIGLNHASGMWTGSEMLVFGSLLDRRNIADTRVSVGAAFDPATNRWRAISESELSPQATSAVWVQGRMVAWDYETRSQEYDPARDAWSIPIEMPLDFQECSPDSAVVEDLVFGFFCGEAALYDAASPTWTKIDGGMLEEEVRSGDYKYKLWRFAELVSTGDTVFLLAEGITVSETDEVCYGCPGSPNSFWAYRPPP